QSRMHCHQREGYFRPRRALFTPPPEFRSTSMTDLSNQLAHSYAVFTRVPKLFQKRTQIATQRFSERVQTVWTKHLAHLPAPPALVVMDGRVPRWPRLPAAVDPVLGHDAGARQPVPGT